MAEDSVDFLAEELEDFAVVVDFLPDETVMETVAPLSAVVKALGSWEMTLPFATVSDASCLILPTRSPAFAIAICACSDERDTTFGTVTLAAADDADWDEELAEALEADEDAEAALDDSGAETSEAVSDDLPESELPDCAGAHDASRNAIARQAIAAASAPISLNRDSRFIVSSFAEIACIFASDHLV